MGYFKRVDCKGRGAHADRLCRAYRGTSPSGKYNPNDIDSTGYCAACRKDLGIVAGQVSLNLR